MSNGSMDFTLPQIDFFLSHYNKLRKEALADIRHLTDQIAFVGCDHEEDEGNMEQLIAELRSIELGIRELSEMKALSEKTESKASNG